MAGRTGGSGGSGFDYVQSSYPNAEEGEELYHTGENAAYVYDGAAWIEQTVVDHAQLSGIGTGDHHSRYADSEAVSAVSSDKTWRSEVTWNNVLDSPDGYVEDGESYDYNPGPVLCTGVSWTFDEGYTAADTARLTAFTADPSSGNYSDSRTMDGSSNVTLSVSFGPQYIHQIRIEAIDNVADANHATNNSVDMTVVRSA